MEARVCYSWPRPAGITLQCSRLTITVDYIYRDDLSFQLSSTIDRATCLKPRFLETGILELSSIQNFLSKMIYLKLYISQ